jgi:ribosomal protein S18 acetylase RimI-like enzyme
MNAIRIAVEPARDLAWYATIPIAYDITEVLDACVIDGGLGGIALTPRAPARPRVKDYDAIPGNAPIDWPDHFDLENWIFLAARVGEEIVGAAAIALETPGVDMLEGRDDLAVLWDLRVLLARRGQGIGAALFRAAERHAIERGMRTLKVETQNINAPACRFYARMGCVLGAIHRHAYPDLPDETQLLWYRALEPGSP